MGELKLLRANSETIQQCILTFDDGHSAIFYGPGQVSEARKNATPITVVALTEEIPITPQMRSILEGVASDLRK